MDQRGTDELDAELRSLDREIAQFVVEAFQRQAPEALRAQLGAALADGLAPLARRMDAIDGAVAGVRSEVVARGETGAERAERLAFELEQAIGRLARELALVRSDLQAAGKAGRASPAVPPGHEDQDDAGRGAPSEPGERRTHGASAGGRPLWPWILTGGFAALLLLIAALIAVFFLPAGPFGAAQRQGDGATSTKEAAGAAKVDADADGFTHVVGLVQSRWSGPKQEAALEALCGPGYAQHGCPTWSQRWAAPGLRKQAPAALAVTVAALAEADGCASPDPAHGEAPDQATVWRCLLSEAGRARTP